MQLSFESKAQGMFWKREQKELRVKGVLDVRLYVLRMNKAIQIKSHQDKETNTPRPSVSII